MLRESPKAGFGKGIRLLAEVEKELNLSNPDKMYTITGIQEVRTVIEITKEMERVYKYDEA